MHHLFFISIALAAYKRIQDHLILKALIGSISKREQGKGEESVLFVFDCGGWNGCSNNIESVIIMLQGAIVDNKSRLQQLQQYTKQHMHHGVNCLSVLSNFKCYIHLCSDPHNIFRYMEEKAICIFLPEFWLLKAEYLAEVGDYSGCFECVQEAHSRNGINEDESEKMIDIGKKEGELLGRMISEMKGFPLKSKRSVDQYSLLNLNSQNSNAELGRNQKKYQKILAVYEEKYGGLRRDKERVFKAKRQGLSESWLAEIYEMEEIQQKKIQERIHENSVRLSREIKYHSMHTPLKNRDPQRLTKTMDSVQILRKKRSTNQKSRRRNLKGDDSDEDEFEKSRTKMVSSVPVGKTFSTLKRRVTFEMARETKTGIDIEHQTRSEISQESSAPVKDECKMIDQASNEFKSLPNPSPSTRL